MERMGLSDEDLDSITGDMQQLLQSAEDLADLSKDEEGENDDGKTATFPFLNRLFGANPNAMQPVENDQPKREQKPATAAAPRRKSANSSTITASTSPRGRRAASSTTWSAARRSSSACCRS